MDYGQLAFFLILAIALGLGIWFLCKQARSSNKQPAIMAVQNTAHCASEYGGKGAVCQSGLDSQEPQLNMIRSGMGCSQNDSNDCIKIEPHQYAKVCDSGKVEQPLDTRTTIHSRFGTTDFPKSQRPTSGISIDERTVNESSAGGRNVYS